MYALIQLRMVQNPPIPSYLSPHATSYRPAAWHQSLTRGRRGSNLASGLLPLHQDVVDSLHSLSEALVKNGMVDEAEGEGGMWIEAELS